MQPDQIKTLPHEQRRAEIKKAMSSFKRTGKCTKSDRPELGLKPGIHYPSTM